jgi:hypothetical protein
MTHIKDEVLKLALEALRLHQRTLAPADTQCKGVAAVAAIEQTLAAPVPEGWKLVPIKPTREMLAVCDEDVGSKIIDGPAYAEAVWMGFLTAAPEKGQP